MLKTKIINGLLTTEEMADVLRVSVKPFRSLVFEKRLPQQD